MERVGRVVNFSWPAVIVTAKYKGGFVGGALTPELVSVYDVVVVCPSTTSTSLIVFIREHVTVSVLEKEQLSRKFLFTVLVDYCGWKQLTIWSWR